MDGRGRLGAISRALRPPTQRTGLASWRDAALRRLIAHAFRNVAFVHDTLADAGIEPGDIRGVADLHRIPSTTKADRQSAGLRSLLARNADAERLLDRSTSGSTGERTVVKRTWFEERLLGAFRRRAMRQYGLTPTDRMAVLLFHRAEDPRDGQSLLRLAQRFGLLRRQSFDALGDPDVARAVAAFAPDVVAGMSSVVARVADEVMAAGHPLRPRFVVTGGELLTEPLRARIAALGAPTHDTYGCNELNLVAWQCPGGAGGYHVCDDAHVVEILGPDGLAVEVGGWGEVVVTSLHSYAMPFLRHRLGDLAVRGGDSCPCGARFSTLLALQGRTIDAFPLRDGTTLHPWEVLNAIKPHMAWVKQFQLVQQCLDDLELRVVSRRPPAPDELQRMAVAGRASVRDRARFAVVPVDAIAADPSGKSRLFVPWRPAA